MFRYKIIPADPTIEPRDLIGYDAAGLLLAIQQLAITEARIMRDGHYWISMRLDDSGVWHVLRQGKPTTTVNEVLMATSETRASST